MTLLDFIQSGADRSHVVEDEFDTLYVRQGRKYLKKKFYENVFTIASVAVKNPGSGSFTRLIERLDQLWHGPIFVESVLTPQFIPLLLRLGFEPVRFDDFGLPVDFVRNLDRGVCTDSLKL